MGRLTHFLFPYIIFGWTTLWLDLLQFILHTHRRAFTILLPKTVGLEPQNHYAGPVLPNRTPTQSSWLISSHLVGVAIFAWRSFSNFYTSLTLARKSSAICCTHSMWATDVSVSISVSCLGSYTTYMCANFLSMLVETVNASSSQG